MAFNLRVIYDERDNLEAWIPEFDSEDRYDTEPGPYEMFCNARLKGTPCVLDSLMIGGFSASYRRVMEEIKEKEGSIPDRYNVPEFRLYDVPLSTVLEYVYQTYVLKRLSPVLEATVMVVQRAPGPEAPARRAILLPEAVLRKTNTCTERSRSIRDDTRLLVRVIDENTLQFSLVLSPSK